ncbi:7992_t:CDS:1, partial [Racocetra persica]
APSKIIQNNIFTIPKNLSLYIPTPEALQIKIKCVRIATMLPQPQTLDEIDIPDSLRLTLNR